jgi:hypothetical protein
MGVEDLIEQESDKGDEAYIQTRRIVGDQKYYKLNLNPHIRKLMTRHGHRNA